MKKDVLWGYISQFLQYGAALLVLPLLLRKLTSAELGVWYVFMTISALVTMLDMGFTPTLARNVSYVFGGASRLLKNGFEVLDIPGPINYALLKIVIKVAQRIFIIIAFGSAILLATLGTWYILHIAKGHIDRQTIIISWSIFVVATVFNIYYKYYTPLLQGRALYSAFYKSNAIANISFVVVTVILLYADMGIISVSIGFLVSALVGRWLSWRYLYDSEFKSNLDKASLVSVSLLEIFLTLWHNAWRSGLGVVGAFLILRANTLLSSAYLGLATTASYALTLQVFSVLQNVSTVAFNVQQPMLARYRVSNQRKKLLKTIEFGLGSALGVFIIGAVMLLWLGKPLINIIGGKTGFLPVQLLAWIGLMMLLELSHSLAAGVIVTGNQVPFVGPALLSGVTVVLLSWVGLKYYGFGVMWIVGVQFVVQLAYNNWKWPWVVYQEFYYKK